MPMRTSSVAASRTSSGWSAASAAASPSRTREPGTGERRLHGEWRLCGDPLCEFEPALELLPVGDHLLHQPDP